MQGVGGKSAVTQLSMRGWKEILKDFRLTRGCKMSSAGSCPHQEVFLEKRKSPDKKIRMSPVALWDCVAQTEIPKPFIDSQ